MSTSHAEQPVDKAMMFQRLPAEWESDLIPQIQALLRATNQKVFVLDDDPTGTQTVHDTIVLTEWSTESLLREMNSADAVCYIMTNSAQCDRWPSRSDEPRDRAQPASGSGDDRSSLHRDQP